MFNETIPIVGDDGELYEEYSEEEFVAEVVDVPAAASPAKPESPASAKTGAQLAGAVKTPIAPSVAPPPGSKNPFETSYAWNAET